MSINNDPHEMLRAHESGGTPYAANYVPEAVRKLCVELAPSSFLDVGCNRGQLVMAVRQESGASLCVGVEMNQKAAEEARKVCDRVYAKPFDAAVAEIRADYPEGFDVIAFADVLEHMYDPWEAMRLAKGLLSTRGKCVFQVPNMVHYSIIGGLLSGRFDYAVAGLMDVSHVRFFTPETFQEACLNAGYKVVHYVSVLKENPQPMVEKLNALISRSEEVREFLRTLGVQEIDTSLLTIWQGCYVCEPL
jgi:SAM-dependent methyltransferase